MEEKTPAPVPSDDDSDLRFLPGEALESITTAILETVPDVERIYLFGSYARGDAIDGSDIDVYAIVPAGAMDELAAYGRAASAKLAALAGLPGPVDLLVSDYERFKTFSNSIWTPEGAVLVEGRLIYRAYELEHDYGCLRRPV